MFSIMHIPFADNVDNLRDRINQVNRILKQNTCVRLKEITEKEAQKYKNYLVLNTKPDYVTGKVGGRQVSSDSFSIMF